MSNKSGLISEDGEVNVSLKSVRLEGRVEGLLMTMKMRQRYVNESNDTIEAVYTFPGGWGSNLMGFNVEIAGKRLSAVCLPKETAEKKYEKAIEEGDTPVMVEMNPYGLYTANLGNLKSGEQAVIEIEYAQMLRSVKGIIRLTVPTVIGARYGDQEAQGGLVGHQKVGTNSLIEYPLTVKLDVMGTLAQGSIECPSHTVDIKRTDSGKCIQITDGALLDRDFILNIESQSVNSYVVVAKEEDSYAMIASFCPELPESSDAPLALKILVDCSGSMSGESIEQVRTAMDMVTRQLKETDLVSYSRFGTDVEHLNPKMHLATKEFIKKSLANAILNTEANLGGTEIKGALRSTYELEVPTDYKKSVNLLLITDGDVWDIDAVIKDAKKFNHRIFAIGVGSAPAESLLQDLAVRTGGACELVTPNESIEEATHRMFERIRSFHTDKIELKCASGLDWRSHLPTQIFSNETIHVFANLRSLPAELPTLSYEINGVTHTCQASVMEVQAESLLPRICAAARIGVTKQEKKATELALKYQLPSQYTNLLLVHEREEDDKATGLPKLERIAQMQAAGWGGFGKTEVLYSSSAPTVLSMQMRPRAAVMRTVHEYNGNALPSVFRTNKTQSASKVDTLSSGGMDDYEIPAHLRKQADVFDFEKPTSPEIEIDKGFPPKSIISYFNDEAINGQNLSQIIEQLTMMTKDSSIAFFIKEHALSDQQHELYWCVILNWLSESLKGVCTLERHAQRLINEGMKDIDESHKALIERDLENKFDCIKRGSWGTSMTVFGSLKTKVQKALQLG